MEPANASIRQSLAQEASLPFCICIRGFSVRVRGLSGLSKEELRIRRMHGRERRVGAGSEYAVYYYNYCHQIIHLQRWLMFSLWGKKLVAGNWTLLVADPSRNTSSASTIPSPAIITAIFVLISLLFLQLTKEDHLFR